jgi:hypothetical protein
MILPRGYVYARLKNSIVTCFDSITYGSLFDSGINTSHSTPQQNSVRNDATAKKSRKPKSLGIVFCVAVLTAVFQAPLSAQTPVWSGPVPTGQSGPPVLSSINPPSAAQGTSVTVSLTGSNFDPSTSVRLSGKGARQGSVVFASPTSVTAQFTLLATTPVGANNVYVVTANGSSNVMQFMVTPANSQTVSLSPAQANLLPSGTQTLTATVTGPGSQTLNWTLSPNVGKLQVTGNTAVYTAPSTIFAPQTVVVTAQSVAQPTASDSSAILLSPQQTLSFNAPTGPFYPSTSQSFTAVGSGTGGGLTWSLSPNVGTLAMSGSTAVYTAPSSIASQQNVVLTAQSNANPSVTASQTLQLNPRVTMSLNPGAVTLETLDTQQFTATVQGTTNVGVTWSLSPNLGTISASGFYTAPSSLPLNAPQTITVTATSVQDNTVSSSAQISLSPGVIVTMGKAGVKSLTYHGQNFLFGPQAAPTFVNVFQTDPLGNTTGAGAVPSATVVDPVANTITQTFKWGTAVTQYKGAGNKLFMTVTMTNTLANPITRYWMFPIGIQLPATPLNFSNNTAFSLDSPASVFFDYGSGTIDLADEDLVNPMTMSFWQATSPAGPAWLVSLNVDPNSNLNPNWPGIFRPLAAGGSDTITVSVRFGAAGQTEPQLASDLFARFNATFPRLLPAAAPRKPIARLNFTGRFRPTLPNNPRGWFNDPSIDVTTPAGIAVFQQRLLQAGDAAVAEMQRVGARGGIIWDLDGQQFDQAFLGDPLNYETISPELVGVLDQFIAKFTNAGFEIGFDLEPQVVTFTTGTVNVSGTQVTWTGGSKFSPVWVGQPAGGEITIGNNTYVIAAVQSPTSLTLQGNAGNQNNAPYTYVLESNVPNPEAILQQKVAYTRNRWKATLFYVDKDLAYGGTNITPSQAFEDIMLQYPGTLFFPEWAGLRHYAYTYPFLDSNNGITEPSPKVTNVYPNAAGLVRVPNDQNIQAAVPALMQSVTNGNILLFDGWYQHPANDTVIQIYQQAP